MKDIWLQRLNVCWKCLGRDTAFGIAKQQSKRENVKYGEQGCGQLYEVLHLECKMQSEMIAEEWWGGPTG